MKSDHLQWFCFAILHYTCKLFARALQNKEQKERTKKATSKRARLESEKQNTRHRL